MFDWEIEAGLVTIEMGLMHLINLYYYSEFGEMYYVGLAFVWSCLIFTLFYTEKLERQAFFSKVAVEKEKEFNKMMMEAIPDPVLFCDIKQKIIRYINPKGKVEFET